MRRFMLFIYKLTANISFRLCKFLNALKLEYSLIILRVDGYMVPVHSQRTRALRKNSLIVLAGKKLPMDFPTLAPTRRTNLFMLRATGNLQVTEADSKGLRYFES